MMVKKIASLLIVICLDLYAQEHNPLTLLEQENSSLETIRDILSSGQMPSDDIGTWAAREEKKLSNSSDQDRKKLGILLKNISENNVGRIDGSTAIETITNAIKTLDQKFELGYLQALMVIAKGTMWWMTKKKETSLENVVERHEN